MLFFRKEAIMKGLKNVVFIFTLLLVLVIAGTVAAQDKCPLCGMTISGNENTSFVVTMKTGESVTYCCAHCGLWVLATEKDKVQSAKTRDFISGEWIGAEKAVYLYKSKAVPACSPSWIAFGSKKEAEMFKKGFGGTIYDYAAALKARAKDPKDMAMTK
jgi:DeoR family transcriptional regulator, copper-sensing transcriptional repressor